MSLLDPTLLLLLLFNPSRTSSMRNFPHLFGRHEIDRRLLTPRRYDYGFSDDTFRHLGSDPNHLCQKTRNDVGKPVGLTHEHCMGSVRHFSIDGNSGLLTTHLVHKTGILFG